MGIMTRGPALALAITRTKVLCRGKCTEGSRYLRAADKTDIWEYDFWNKSGKTKLKHEIGRMPGTVWLYLNEHANAEEVKQATSIAINALCYKQIRTCSPKLCAKVITSISLWHTLHALHLGTPGFRTTLRQSASRQRHGISASGCHSKRTWSLILLAELKLVRLMQESVAIQSEQL